MNSSRKLWIGFIVIVILLPIVYSVIDFAIARSPSGELFLERTDARYTNCVKDSTWMRYHHWELLRGVREEVVRYGKRGDVGLFKCRECHTSRENFCNRCHDAVNLTPDCWGCHYYP